MTVQLLPGETWDGIWDDLRTERMRARKRFKLKWKDREGIGVRSNVLRTFLALSPIAIKQISANIPIINKIRIFLASENTTTHQVDLLENESKAEWKCIAMKLEELDFLHQRQNSLQLDKNLSSKIRIRFEFEFERRFNSWS